MKKLIKEQVYEAIVGDIMSGTYVPQMILNEKALVERFGVSKSPVRDALTELCCEGVLRSIPRVGYEVVQLDERDMREIMELRWALESHCLEWTVSGIQLDDIVKIQSFLLESERWAEQEHDITEHWDNNIRFHLLLVSLAKNRQIHDALERAMRTQLRGYAQFYWDKWHQPQVMLDMETHRKIVEAVVRRDTEKALGYLRADLGRIAEIRDVRF